MTESWNDSFLVEGQLQKSFGFQNVMNVPNIF